MSTKTNNDITPDEAYQPASELGTLADYSRDEIDYDTPTLYNSLIEGIEYNGKHSDSYYTGEFYRENGFVYFLLEDGNTTLINPLAEK